MQLFYQPDSPQATWLPEEESKHCSKVLRHRPGDTIWVTNGKNQLFECRLQDPNPSRCTFSIVGEKEQPVRPYKVKLAIAPTKNTDRLEWMLEKCVELGIDQISLLQCQHSERIKINMDRLQKKAVSAMKQSLNLQLPQIDAPQPFDQFIQEAAKNSDILFIAYVDDTPRPHLMQAAKPSKIYWILIGPEGDFSSDEIKAALVAGFEPVQLGPNRLRTETAGLVSCHTLNLLNQLHT